MQIECTCTPNPETGEVPQTCLACLNERLTDLKQDYSKLLRSREFEDAVEGVLDESDRLLTEERIEELVDDIVKHAIEHALDEFKDEMDEPMTERQVERLVSDVLDDERVVRERELEQALDRIEALETAAAARAALPWWKRLLA